jgi:adenylate kinase
MVITIIGGPGSGKDTQAEFISKKYNIPHVSTGQIFREESRKGDALAKKAIKIANQGDWVPDEIASAVLQKYLEKHCTKGFVLTGYPRPVEQIRSLDRILREMKLDLTAVLHIEVPDEVLAGRMKTQIEDSAKAGDERSDTSDEAMKKRLQAYHETIRPLLNEYFHRGQLINIDGTPSIEEVRESIFSELEKLIEKE